MVFEHITHSAQKTSTWSGGTTTQLYIFPKDADYQQRNFSFRISSACVEVESSTFTRLPGIERHLMILDGKLQLDHKNYYKKDLQPFDSDNFMGHWETNAKGCVTDFNLMLANNVTGQLESVQLNTEHITISKAQDFDFTGLYLWKGRAMIDNTILHQGDFIGWFRKDNLNKELQIASLEPESILIISHVKL